MPSMYDVFEKGRESRHGMPSCNTDPIGRDLWSMGTVENFICFDWCRNRNSDITNHAVVKSESSRAAEDFDKVTTPMNKAGARAHSMVQAAWDWLVENVGKLTETELRDSEAAANNFLHTIYIEPYVDRCPPNL